MSSVTSPTATEVDRIVDQLERAFEGDAWHGSSISEILADIQCEVAAARPLPDAHSIWEIVLHTIVWQRTVRERLQGKPIRELPDHEDWPPVSDTSCEAWEETIRDLRTEYELLRDEARGWHDHDLGQTFEGQRYTVYQMLHGVIQHGLYHAGQIAVLKKAGAKAD
jgi:uncharacterized damage-inducible protein DinB